jgi:prolyl-tRNA synthetase
MAHSDDDGLRVPPRLAPKHVVILPVIPKPELENQILEYADRVAAEIGQANFCGAPIRVTVDRRDKRGGEKNWQWIKKGIPVRIEVGPRDIEKDSVMVARRDRAVRDKQSVSRDALPAYLADVLPEIQQNYFNQALKYRDENLVNDIGSFDQLVEFFTPDNKEQPEIHGGFVRAKYADSPEAEKLLAEHKLTVRCLPEDQSGEKGSCIVTGKPADKDAIIAKAY